MLTTNWQLYYLIELDINKKCGAYKLDKIDFKILVIKNKTLSYVK